MISYLDTPHMGSLGFKFPRNRDDSDFASNTRCTTALVKRAIDIQRARTNFTPVELNEPTAVQSRDISMSEHKATITWARVTAPTSATRLTHLAVRQRHRGPGFRRACVFR
jgi:hypothetical protein